MTANDPKQTSIVMVKLKNYLFIYLILVPFPAYAHGQTAVIFGVSVLMALVLIPFLIFIYFFRASKKKKIVFLILYLLSGLISLYIALSLDESTLNAQIVDYIFFGIPLFVWIVGYYLARENSSG